MKYLLFSRFSASAILKMSFSVLPLNAYTGIFTRECWLYNWPVGSTSYSPGFILGLPEWKACSL